MKPLDKNKKYDLSQLNDEQLQAVYTYCNFVTYKGRDFKYLKNTAGIMWGLTNEVPDIVTNALELFDEDLKTYQITEYATCDFGDLGIKQGTIKAKDKEHAWLLHKESNRLKEQEKGFFSFVQIKDNEDDISERILTIKDALNHPLTDNNTSVYDDMLSLIKKGKQQGLKIVVTFEKL